MDMIDTRQYHAARDDMGSLWTNFEEMLLPEQAELLNTAYTLITLVPRENNLSTIITTILIDDKLEHAERINIVRRYLTEGIVELLLDLGVIINKDYVDLNTLSLLNTLLNTLYITDQIEDVLNLIAILDNETYSNKDKLIAIIVKVNDLPDEDNLDYIIEDVSADVIKGLYIGIGALDADDTDYINPEVATRIKQNKAFLKGTLAGNHIINGGGVGFSFDRLSTLFINELGLTLANNKDDYYKEILALLLISSATTIEIETNFNHLVNNQTESLNEIYSANKILESANL